jgi:hypothetical protein
MLFIALATSKNYIKPRIMAYFTQPNCLAVEGNFQFKNATSDVKFEGERLLAMPNDVPTKCFSIGSMLIFHDLSH